MNLKKTTDLRGKIMDAEQAWQEFKKLGVLTLKYKRKAQLLIPKLAETKIYLKHGFATLEEAASILAGISSTTVKKILSVHRRTENLPNLRATMQSQGYAKVDAVLVLADKLEENELVHLTKSLPTRTLRQKVQEIKWRFSDNNSVISDKNNHTLDASPHSESPHKQELLDAFNFNNFDNSDSHYTQPLRFSAKISAKLQQDLNIIKHNIKKEKKHPITNYELLKHLVEAAKQNKKQKECITKSSKKINSKKVVTSMLDTQVNSLNYKQNKKSSYTKKVVTTKLDTAEKIVTIKNTKSDRIIKTNKIVEVDENNYKKVIINEYPRAKTNKTLTPKHKDFVKQQNNYICQAKNCNRVATEVHHVNYQSLHQKNNKIDDLKTLPAKHVNLRALCKIHHQLEHFGERKMFIGNTYSNAKNKTENSKSSLSEKNEFSQHQNYIKTDAERHIDAKVQEHWCLK